MELALTAFRGSKRRGRARRHSRTPAVQTSRQLARTAIPKAPTGSRTQSEWCLGSRATVAELSQVPGARQALADYIGILQEWSSRAEHGGAAPRGWPQ